MAGHLDPRRLVFIDETWIKTNMAPLRGWGPRVSGYAAWRRWSLAHADLPRRSQARSAHRTVHLRWADQRRMLPRLCRAATRADIEAWGHRDHGQSRQPQEQGRAQRYPGRRRKALVLAALLPDLNPIEQAFAKIKHWMRSAQKRTIADTWRHIGRLVDTIDPTECNNYFANAGYASVKK